MTDDQLLETIINTSFVKADVLRRTRIVREYLEQKFFTPGEKKNLKEFLEGLQASEDDTKVLSKWGDAFFHSFTKENAYELLDKINGHVKDLPSVNLYVPVTLEPDDVAKLGDWFRKNVDSNVIIELHVESSTFGGCAFAWNGVYTDYSLKHYLHKRMDAISKVLTEFTTT
jgi:F0F1-type ATP synthase delta subunit